MIWGIPANIHQRVHPTLVTSGYVTLRAEYNPQEGSAIPWQDALRTVLEFTYDTAEKEGVGWAVVGSTATALQGCRLTPHDLDLLAQEPRSVFRFAELLSPFAAAGSAGVGDSFLSTPGVPVQVFLAGGHYWHFARWMIDGFAAEVAHIADTEGHDFHGDVVWECGPALWSHLRRVAFAGYSVPVVPLEFQVGINLDRDRTKHGEDNFDRVGEIARVFRANGYDRPLLEWALSPAHLARFDEVMRAQ